jgi:multiple sugar transport system permease protein/putative aldouronate transport system permease protein
MMIAKLSKKNGKNEYGVKIPLDDMIYYAVVYIAITILTLSVLYPLVYIVSCSFSNPQAVAMGKVTLLPVGFFVGGYQRVFSYTRVYIGFRNSIIYTAVGTFFNVIMTLFCAYPLARKNLPHRNFFMFFFCFTMLFNGGMIPTYLVMRDLHLLNTPWVMMLPTFGVYNMIITRTYIQTSISEELLESAKIDGCNDIAYFWKFILPLSKPVIAVCALQYAVGHWNAYFNAFIYLTNKDLFPLQVFLREILVLSQINPEDFIDEETAIQLQGMTDLIKYALIVVATIPILFIYPFIQKYFVKGIMVGSLKG